MARLAEGRWRFLSDPLAVTIEVFTRPEGEQAFVTLGANTFGTLMVAVGHLGATMRASFRFVIQHRRREGVMKREYNFSKGRRGAVIPQVGKTRITIYLDDGVLERFKAQSKKPEKDTRP